MSNSESRRRSILRSSRSRTPIPQNENYGRLSPPPDECTEVKQEEIEELTSDQMKEALQRHAYDAVLSNDTKEWSLVSVDGHVVESEL